MTDADDDSRGECGQEIHGAQGAVQFTIDLSFIQEIRTGNVKYGFLRVDGVGREEQEKEQ